MCLKLGAVNPRFQNRFGQRVTKCDFSQLLKPGQFTCKIATFRTKLEKIASKKNEVFEILSAFFKTASILW